MSDIEQPEGGIIGLATTLKNLQIIVNQCVIPNSNRQGTASGRTDVQIQTRYSHTIGPQPVSQIQVGNCGFYLGATGETVIGNDYTWEAAIELTSPVTYQEFYTIGTVIADIPNGCPIIVNQSPVGYDFAAGTLFWLRQGFIISVDTNFLPLATGGSPTGSAGYISPLTTSQVPGTGALTTPAGGTAFGVAGPPLILGVPALPMAAVCYVGDSIADGTGDTIYNPNGDVGFIGRGLHGVNGFNTPYVKSTVGSWTYSNAGIDKAPRMRAVWPYVTHIINELGTNDIANATTLSTMQGYATAMWQAQKRVIGPYGKPLQVAQTLIMPRTTSTDSWATAANQTPIAGFTVGGVRDQFNSWVKAQVGGGLLDAYIDVNQYVEDQSNSGKWITNGTANYPTTDGIHPSTALHILAAQSVNAWALNINP